MLSDLSIPLRMKLRKREKGDFDVQSAVSFNSFEDETEDTNVIPMIDLSSFNSFEDETQGLPLEVLSDSENFQFL